MTNELDRALDTFVEQETEFVQALKAADYERGGQVLCQCTDVAKEIYWRLATEGAVASNHPALPRFREEGFNLQQALRDCYPGHASLAVALAAGPRSEPPPGGGWLADPELSRLLDPEDPDSLGVILDRLLSVQVIIARRELPSWLRRHVGTIRRCYALRLIEPTWLFLRALIEAASFHWLTEHGHVARGRNVSSLAEWRLGESLRLVNAHSRVPKVMLQRVRGVVKHANRLVHAKGDVARPVDNETLRAIDTVVAYVECLFGS